MYKRFLKQSLEAGISRQNHLTVSRNLFHTVHALHGSKQEQVDLTPEAVKTAFQPELAQLNTHCMLLNQTSPRQLLELTDVLPMMSVFRSLVANKAAHLGVRRVARALKQTAKDSSHAFRTLPQIQRLEQTTKLFAGLRGALDEVAGSLIEVNAFSTTNFDKAAAVALLQGYEIVDPSAGVKFYTNLAQSLQAECGAAVIPCMVKSRQPFPDIQRAFKNSRDPKPRDAATLAWACLRYGEIDAAEALLSDLTASEGESSPVWTYLVDAFVGDAPANLALDTFRKHITHVPHHAAVRRLLQRLWDNDPNIDLQLTVLREYLQRLAMPSELAIKTVAFTVVTNVIKGSADPDVGLRNIQQLCRIYDEYVPSHTILLNVILTEASRKWGSHANSAKDLILGIFSNYEPRDNDSVVSFRVRLNALETLSGVDEIVSELWTSRKNSPQPLERWDWFALVRATNASEVFVEEWKHAGSPFEHHVRRFCNHKNYKI